MHAEIFSNCGREKSKRPKLSDTLYFFVVKFVIVDTGSASLSMAGTEPTGSAFVRHIGIIFRLTGKKQMIRIDARSYVAAMTHAHSGWDSANRHGVGKTMCINNRFPDLNCSVAIAP